jgi:hypothetical protein
VQGQSEEFVEHRRVQGGKRGGVEALARTRFDGTQLWDAARSGTEGIGRGNHVDR